MSQVARLNLANISTKIEQTLDEISNSLKTLSLGPLSNSVTASAKSLEKILDEKKWDRLMSSITGAGDKVSGLSTQASTTISRLEAAMDQNGPALGKSISSLGVTIGDLAKFINRLDQTVVQADALLNSGQAFVLRTDSRIEDLESSLRVSLGNLESATDKLNRFLDTIAAQPSQIVFGAPAADRNPDETGKQR